MLIAEIVTSVLQPVSAIVVALVEASARHRETMTEAHRERLDECNIRLIERGNAIACNALDDILAMQQALRTAASRQPEKGAK